MVFVASHVIIGKLAVKLAKTAPIPSVTRIIGKAQQIIVEMEANNPKNGNNVSFILIILAINFNNIIAIICNDVGYFFVR